MKARPQFLMRRFLRACPSLIKRRVEENHSGEIFLFWTRLTTTQEMEGNIDSEYQKDKGIIIMNANETTGSIGRM